MATASARLTFSFRLHTSKIQPPRPKPKTHLPLPLHHSIKTSISPLHRHPKRKFTSASIDVTKEDKPISENSTPKEPISQNPQSFTIPADDSPPESGETKFDPRRLEERFAVLNTGIYECRSCGHRYDESAGDPAYPIPPGLEFGKLPEDWRCPTCGAAKSFFVSKSVEIAGFAQNQQFGLGGNTLTSGQKAVLIYGSLFFTFLLFLSGYFLQ
ncbi:rubredoxin-like superfamily protein [Tasmannia lanceolata]|uniref:rubredoxin-like superfamily protein n=1 Tax=Tasmannia lanceolata TaxID=3420 RepID=UPI004064A133